MMAPGKRRFSFLTLFGVLLLSVGLGYLGYVGWEFYGTSFVSNRAAMWPSVPTNTALVADVP